MPRSEKADSNEMPWSEAERSAMLHSYGILDTPPEQDFDDLAQLASDVCGTPVALVSIVDTHRQFFKAGIGFDQRETPISSSFCAHALLEDEIMIVPDATKDPRFAGNPFVTADNGIRFYAGALMKTADGIPLGTLCVLDRVPRQLDERQLRTLRVLARQAMTHIELRHKVGEQQRIVAEQHRILEKSRATEHEKAMLARVVEQSSDFIAMADPEGQVFFLNDSARRMVGLAHADISTTNVVDYFVDEDRAKLRDTAMPAVIEEGWWEGELLFRDFSAVKTTPMLCSIFPLHDHEDNLVGHGLIGKDVTAQKAEQQRRADIIGEISHRMKNTLAMVQAIVSQTFRTARTIDEGRNAISGRLAALARAQDILTSASSTTARIDDVVATALAPHRSGQGRFALSGPPIELTAQQSLGLSLAIHELATNAAKYGALLKPDGSVAIEWDRSDDGRFSFRWVEVDGPPVSQPAQSGFGSKLMERIVAPYFDGRSELEFAAAGLCFRLTGKVMNDDGQPPGVRN